MWSPITNTTIVAVMSVSSNPAVVDWNLSVIFFCTDLFKKKFLDLRLKPLSLGKKMSELAEQFVPEILGNSYSDEVLENAINSMSKIPIILWVLKTTVKYRTFIFQMARFLL